MAAVESKRVLVIANNLRQASYRLRIEALRPGLAERGIHLEVMLRPRGWLARRKLLRRARAFDAVLLQRKLLGAGDIALLRTSGRPIFYDVDDAVMHHSHRAGPLERWRTWRRFLATARGVDHVVAGNRHLAEMFQRQGAKATVLPTVVDPRDYAVKEPRAADAPALVWIGSRSTLQYLQQFLPVLAEARRHVPGLRLITIADAELKDSPLPTEHVTWSEEAKSIALIRGDIGIAPMPSDPWTLGKSGFKIVQYMAAGLPVIASPVGANAELVRAGTSGFLAESPAEWVDGIVMLCGDPELRKRMGQAGRERVENELNIERAVETWASLLRPDPGSSAHAEGRSFFEPRK